MSIPAVSGLQTALKLYASEKVRERTEGHNLIRSIFSNSENLHVFQETAGRDGGAGWIALFQCLFQVVVLEKKGWTRKSTAPQAERRLGDAISLVRWMTEKTVHLLSRKPFMSLFTHMSHLLVYSSTIFQPAALDYAKALRNLLSYPPHLENLDQQSWKLLMGICWAALLDEEVNLDDTWDDTSRADIDQEDLEGHDGWSKRAGKQINAHVRVSSAVVELAKLIPMLLSSSAAPIIPSLPSANKPYNFEPSTGLRILQKVHSFLRQRSTNESVELNILTSMNLVLVELELNCRNDLVTAGTLLFPQLASMWHSSGSLSREQLLIAVRLLLPHLAREVQSNQKTLPEFHDGLQAILDFLPRETTSRWGYSPLDIDKLRLRLLTETDRSAKEALPFELPIMTAGMGFTHEAALSWTMTEMYSEVVFQLHAMSSVPHDRDGSEQESTSAKRRRTEDSMTVLLGHCRNGSDRSRTQHIQVLLFLTSQHRSFAMEHHHQELLDLCMTLMDDDNSDIQNWGLLLSATILYSTVSDHPCPTTTIENFSGTAWRHALRKITNPLLSRASSHLGNALLSKRLVPSAQLLDDIGNFLKSIDIQGPPQLTDSVCMFVSRTLQEAKGDVRLYSQGLGEHALAWIYKWSPVETSSGKTKPQQLSPSDILSLNAAIGGLRYATLPSPATSTFLPHCAIVSRVMEEYSGNAIRRYNLRGEISQGNTADAGTEIKGNTAVPDQSEERGFLEGIPRRLSSYMVHIVEEISKDLSSLIKPDVSTTAPVVSPDRVRRAIDIIVVAAAYQGLLKLNGMMSDDTCLTALDGLIPLVRQLIQSSAYDDQSRLLMWSGLDQLVPPSPTVKSVWPALLMPSGVSGIRHDLLPLSATSDTDVGFKQADTEHLLQVVWNLPKISSTLKDFFPISLNLLSNTDKQNREEFDGAKQYQITEDDDFGDISKSDSEALPQAHDVTGARSGILKTVLHFRLQGTRLCSSNLRPIRDSHVINALLDSEGSRLVDLAKAVNYSLQQNILRLSTDAVDLVLGYLEDMISSYAYSKNEDMICITIDFLTLSSHIWLDDEELSHRAIQVAKSLVAQNSQDQLLSWRVRLSLLLLIDEYLDYDPDMTAWDKGPDNDVQMADDLNPTTVISGSLVDRDIRVRFRAATSTAGLLYLSSIPVDRQTPFYLSTVDCLPREPRHWDSFLTDILWKLNCCVASAQLRAATIYHLYEIPVSSSKYNVHLQRGMENVAARLGLQGVSQLYLAHAPLIVSSQICAGQSPIKVPPALYGYLTRKESAYAILCEAGSGMVLAMLAEQRGNETNIAGATTVYSAMCDAANVSTSAMTSQLLPAIFARALCDHSIDLWANSEAFTLERAMKALDKLFGEMRGRNALSALKSSVEEVIGDVFRLLDLSSVEDAVTLLDSQDTTQTRGSHVFGRMLGDPQSTISTPALPPTINSAQAITAIDFIQTSVPTVSTSKALLHSLIRLFENINSTFLIAEQHRYLRAIAFAVSIYAAEIRHPSILGFYLTETLPLLQSSDTFNEGLSMTQWGFLQLAHAAQIPDKMASIFVSIGKVYKRLHEEQGADDQRASLFRDWILKSIKSWEKVTNLKDALQIAEDTWPEELQQDLLDIHPTLSDLESQAEQLGRSDMTHITKRMYDQLRTQDEAAKDGLKNFECGSFWTMKGNINELSEQGVSAFLDLLCLTSGNVHPPHLDSQRAPIQDSRASVRNNSKDHTQEIRAQIVEIIVDRCWDDDFAVRLSAIKSLRLILPHINDLLSSTALSKRGKDFLSLLTPSAPMNVRPQDGTTLEFADEHAWNKKAQNTTEWCRSLVATLCTSMKHQQAFFLALLASVKHLSSIMSAILPSLVHAYLPLPELHKATSDRTVEMSHFFETQLASQSTPLEILQIIVSIMLHLRQQKPPHIPQSMSIHTFESWLEVDHVVVSKAAIRCGFFSTALLFLELARSATRNERASIDLSDEIIQDILYETYSNVEDPDGFYGVKTYDVAKALQRRLVHENSHWRSFGLSSAVVEASRSTHDSIQSCVAGAKELHQLGFDRMSSLIVGAIRGQDTGLKIEEDDELSFTLAWRTGDWDLPVTSTVNLSPSAMLYTVLRSVHREREMAISMLEVKRAIHIEMTRLQSLGGERMTQIRESVMDLICLREVQQWISASTQTALQSESMDSEHLSRYTDINDSYSFADAERLVAIRRCLFSSAIDREEKTLLGDITTPMMQKVRDMEQELLLKISRKARLEGQTQAAVNAITAIKLMTGAQSSDSVEDEFGQVLWAQQEHNLAIQHLEQRIELGQGSGIHNGRRQALLLGHLAAWTARARYRPPESIKATFDDARRLADLNKISTVEQSQLYHDYAWFTDGHQRALATSPELERLSMYVERKEVELQVTSSATSGSKRAARSSAKTNAQSRMQQELQEDEAALQDIVSRRSSYVNIALRMYASAFALTEKYDDSVTRMVSLWLEYDQNDAVNANFAAALNRVPSHKFIFLGPQLSARLDRPKSPTTFNNILNNLILRISRQHPFHILYQIITLAEGFVAAQKNRRVSDGGAEGRAPAAAYILSALSGDASHQLAATAATQMKSFEKGAVQWCLLEHDKEERISTSKPLPLPSNFPLRNLVNLTIPIPTSPPPIDPTSKYEGIPTLVRFRSHYNLLGGLHRPKKMQVYDSMHNVHKQLFKGDDEVRQDAVMEQVFVMSNRLLSTDRQTRERNLRFRTYVVIPLAHKTGLLEFVGDTMGIGDWLKPAHHRYGPLMKDTPAEQFKKVLQPIQEKEKEWHKLPSKYNEMMKNFHPVMRHFFTEKHPDPLNWFTMRLNYTRSAAVTSMIGWMLGIGDRHCSNILIDQTNGELVHIDFGIVFEDGQRLRIPEKVPFRLTNDIVDGFGITGVDGTYRRCSEQTLRVLRESSELIMTILEVFKHDPLYAWDADPEKVQRAQGGGPVNLSSSASALEKADRILSKVRQKLRDDLSLEYKVNELIQEARDTEHLAKIFVGWQPWF